MPDWTYVSDEEEVAKERMKERKKREKGKGKETEKGKGKEKEKEKGKEKRKEVEDATGSERPVKKGRFHSRDYEQTVLYTKRKEHRTGENASMGEIRGALKETVEYTSTEEDSDKESEEEAPK